LFFFSNGIATLDKRSATSAIGGLTQSMVGWIHFFLIIMTLNKDCCKFQTLIGGHVFSKMQGTAVAICVVMITESPNPLIDRNYDFDNFRFFGCLLKLSLRI
jgi:hypothetical protein